MTRRFVLVTAVAPLSSFKNTVGSGIRKLRRGVTLKDFVDEFVEPLKVTMVLERDGGYTAIRRGEDGIWSWTFTEYPEDELFSAVSHLTKEELYRDLNELLPLKALG